MFTDFLDRVWAALHEHPWETRDVSVGAIVDADFGDRFAEPRRSYADLGSRGPRRIGPSREGVRATLPDCDVTPFIVDPASTPDAWCIEEVGTIELHHREYSKKLRVLGAGDDLHATD